MMQFLSIPFVSRPRPTVKSGARVAGLLGVLAAIALGAFAQVPNPAPHTEQPSPKNPTPRAGGDAQNRNRAHDDKYWGITDANRRYYETPFSRIPDPTTVARGNGRFVADGWQFPRLASIDPARQPLAIDAENVATLPITTLAVAPGVEFVGSNWANVIAPAEQFQNANYQRALAVPRPSGAPTNTIADTANTVKWFPFIAGQANVLRRYAIRVYLPTPEALPENGDPRTEERIEDARYIVTYQTRNNNGNLVTRTATVLTSQSGSGYVTLANTSGDPIFFPMATEATGLTGNDRPRVELDNTTSGDINNNLPTSGTYVIADQIQFVPASEYGEIKAPTSVTPIHGGRKVPRAQLATLGAPYANQLFQPVWTAQLITSPYSPGTDLSFLNDSFDFINNPRQLDYPANPETGIADDVYTNGTSPFFQPFEPWNPSTLFQGPRSLIDDQTDPNIPGFETGRLPFDPTADPALNRGRTNNQRYEVVTGDPDVATNPVGTPRPLFSQMQALVPRTEYVPDPTDITGLRSLAVGCVYSVDWTTGAPIWRFPDRTYLPEGYEDQYGNPVARAGLRNPNTTKNNVIVPTVPGIGAYDKNGDGYISDDEVYIVGQGSNASGALESGITIVPRLKTRAVGVRIPTYSNTYNPYNAIPNGTTSASNLLTPITGFVTAPEGRYANPDAAKTAVETGVAIVASDNGVVYAIDAYGNNDNRYYTVPDAVSAPDAQGNQPVFGTYHAGSTNVLWSFSETAPVRRNNERVEEYNLRLKRSVPATGAWGRSTPVVAYEKSDDDATLNRFNEDPRLFIGNANGVVYALNPIGNATTTVEDPPNSGIFVTTGTAPFRKDAHTDPTTGIFDLRWWFETQGAITAAPAVSVAVQPELPGGVTPNAKGVYVTSNDGRVYCIDWTGPVTKVGTAHTNNLTYSGSDASAEALNDNFRFHNGNNTNDFGRADGTEGTIRPRWVFPSRYRDITGTDNSELAPVDPADVSIALGNDYRVERQTRLAPINSAPVLIDFPYRNPTSGDYSLKSYVAVVANDLNGNNSPITGRVYLLDQVGDRRDFSVKPVQRDVPAPVNTKIAFGQPEDMYAPSDFVFSDATPAWTYRPVYARYNNPGTIETVQARNRPNQLIIPTTPGLGLADDPTDRDLLNYPEKRVSPTVFVGGTTGRVFALDIDPTTGLFTRWQDTILKTRSITPLPTNYTDARNLPANVEVGRRLDPPNPVLGVPGSAGIYGTLNDRPVLARTIAALNADDVSAITISGGPEQNRNHPYANDTPLGNGPTSPFLPTNDTPNAHPFGSPFTFGSAAVTGTQIVPVTPIRPFYWNGTNVTNDLNGDPLDFTGFVPPNVPVNVLSFDLRGRFTNQDIDDPAATTGGSNANVLIPGLSSVFLPNENRSYQYPVLAVTTTDGAFTLISTELEGLDADDGTNIATNPQTDDDGAFLGWALTNDLVRANPTRPLLLSLRGPGGPSTQVTMITNAYYGAMDPGFRNTVQKLVTDSSATGFPRYPWNEPRNVGTLTTAPFGDPRPRFEPRSLYAGNEADPNGPDGDPLTGDGIPRNFADAHTGRTGLPLDLRGLFYDKAYAANTTGDNTNDDGLYRLPAYSGIGEELLDAQRRARFAQNTAFTNNANNLGAAYGIVPDGTPDVPRDNSTGATSPYRTDPFKLFPGALDPTDATIRPEADINPPGTNVAWMFVGGADGVFYGYTPNRFTDPNFGGGLGSGLGGGNPNPNPDNDPARFGSPKVILVDEGTFNTLRASGTTRPDLSQGLQANGNSPVYEYGESVYAVVYDVAANANTRINVAFTPVAGNVARTTNGGTQRILVPATVEGAGYPYDPADATAPRDPSLGNATPTQLRLAFARIPITTNSAANGVNGGNQIRLNRNAAQSTGWTPGVVYNASILGDGVTLGSGTGVGATERQAIANQPPAIQIANPIAVQGFLLENRNGSLAAVADPENNGRVYNGIGPFVSQSNFTAGVKTRVAKPSDLTGTDNTAFDPDRFKAEYGQALTNGNTILRIDSDLYERDASGNVNPAIRNTRFGQRFVAGTGVNGGSEPAFYLPVAASAGLIDSGKTNSTNVTNTRRNLRIANRSLQRNLAKMRVDILGDALFRSWPGTRPNVAPTDGTTNVAGQTVGARDGNGNPRLTPVNGNAYAMSPSGIINALPWEQPTSESLPWERINPNSALASVTGNTSRDYPDISTSPGGAGKQPIKVVMPGGDAVQSDSTLTASIGGTGAGRVNQTVVAGGTFNGAGAYTTPPALQQYNYAGTSPNFLAGLASVEISVPNYQPANLVAMHSLTSTYQQPSAEEDPGQGLTAGVLQLPRTSVSDVNRAVTDRALRTVSNPANPTIFAPGTGDNRTITPMGYTVKMRAYLDINSNGRFDETEPFREFETWFGVPVNIEMVQGNGTISLPGTGNSALAHGFGQQNGYLGYGRPAAVGQSIGFLPPFLQDTTTAVNNPYGSFFAPITVQSKSNINLWNVRASQKIEQYNPAPSGGNAAGDGTPFTFFAMQGELVNSRFGIMSQKTDPLSNSALPNVMPNVVTSVDKKFDTSWDNFVRNLPDYQVPLPNGQTRYQVYYAQFGGRHPLHKPAPGSTGVTVLSVPDLPTTSLPPTSLGGVQLPPPPTEKPQLGIAVPLGTPSGQYSNGQSGTPLVFFEDYDTQSLVGAGDGYKNIPIPSGTPTTLIIGTAGPLYNGQGVLHPGTFAKNAAPADPGSQNVIRPLGNEAVLRPQSIISNLGGQPKYEYLPSTTAFGITLTVGEAALTGGVADQTLSTTFPQSVVTGLLPGIDSVPRFDLTNIGLNGGVKPASSLAPAAYRTRTGNMVMFYNTNVDPTTLLTDARTGAPFQLLRTAMEWEGNLGTWKASATGIPIDGSNVFNQTSPGSWFTTPAIPPALVGNGSFLSPFVMHDPRLQGGLANAAATLLTMSVQQTSSGASEYVPYYASLDDAGVPGVFTPVVPITGANRVDGSLRRFAPRGVFVKNENAPDNSSAFVTYYGGGSGKNNILYVGVPADNRGAITAPPPARQPREQVLQLPSSVKSASDPMPVVRRVIGDPGSNGLFVYSATGTERYVVDVYYSAVLQTGNSSDLCMTRYRIDGNGTGARLVPMDLPRQTNELLTGNGRTFTSQSFGWYNRAGVNAPSITISGAPPIGPAGWQVDAASKLLYQSVTYKGAPMIVYVDPAAGSVTFRGKTAPTSTIANLEVRATFLPLGTRVAATAEVEASPFGFMERTAVQPTYTFNGNTVPAGDANVGVHNTPVVNGGIGDGGTELTLGGLSTGVVTRYGNWDNTNGQGIDRQWLYWQRAGKTAQLFYSTRRVGVDLKSAGVGAMAKNESFLLGGKSRIDLDPTLPPVIFQTVVITSVQADGVDIPFEVDVDNGKIYTQAKYEGQEVTIIGGQKVVSGTSNASSITVPPGTKFTMIDETTGLGGAGVGQAVPMSKEKSNENQPYAFFDTFDPSALNRNAAANPEFPVSAFDPVLQPGRVWLFWTSGRSRTGLVRIPDTTYQGYFGGTPVGQSITGNGYNLYWQTLAPNFNPPSTSGFPNP